MKPLILHVPRATVATQMDGCWFHSRQKKCGYPRKKTVHQTDMWLLSYKPRKSVTAHTKFSPLSSTRQAGARPLVTKSLTDNWRWDKGYKKWKSTRSFIYSSNPWIWKLTSTTFVIPTTAMQFNSYVCLFNFIWSTYEGWETFDHKIWTYQVHTLSPYIRNLILTPQHEVSGRCFGHPDLKRPVVLGINYVNFVNIALW